MEKGKVENIFGKLDESSLRLRLQPNEFTFKVDRQDGTFLGSVVNIDGTLYENSLAGDGLGQPIRAKAQKAGFKFVTSVDAGLFR